MQLMLVKLSHGCMVEALKVAIFFELLLNDAADMIQEVQLQVLHFNAITSNVIEDIIYLLVSDAIHS
jgi:hypothetical protein